MTNLLDPKATWSHNPKVRGTYYGQAFTGQVVADRLVCGSYMHFTVQLDSPITVYGEDRTRVIITSSKGEMNTLFAV